MIKQKVSYYCSLLFVVQKQSTMPVFFTKTANCLLLQPQFSLLGKSKEYDASSCAKTTNCLLANCLLFWGQKQRI